MKNILFVVFLFLPFLSYSQTALSSFEENAQDSSLTIFLKASNTEPNRDTVYTKVIPQKIIFIFEDIDSANRDSYTMVTLARGKMVINSVRANRNKVDYPAQYAIWQTDIFVIEAKDTRKDSTRTFLQSIQILPKPILEKVEREEKKRIQDSTNRIENLKKTKRKPHISCRILSKTL